MDTLIEHYTIAICTQGKNLNLSNAITKLREIKKSTKQEIEILVVLNSLSSNFVKSEDVRVVFEPNLGYSSVRNTALDSIKSGSNLIFIDDDEIPNLIWFENLVLMHEKYHDEVITGPIYPYREDSIKTKSYRNQFRQLYESRSDETKVNQGATANMLIPASLIGQDAIYFDLHFNESGSEDTDFCFRARNAGYSIRYAKKAAILEIETAQRYNTDYLNKRFIRDVANYSVVIRRNANIGTKIYRGLTLIGRIIFFGICQIINVKNSTKFEAYRASFFCLLTGKVRL